MRELLYELSGYRQKKDAIWVIWGMADRGVELLKYIRKLDTQTVYFADNDVRKQGKSIEGIICISREEVEKIADECVILVASYRNTDLYEDLHNSFPHVIPDIIFEILNFYPKAHGFNGFMPLGHFYSQYPDMDKIEKKRDLLYRIDKAVKDIDFNVEGQWTLLKQMKELLASIPKWTGKADYANSIYRYHTDTAAFCVPDATCLHLMLRILKPNRLIEVGSGWSSAVTLDTNEFYFNKEMRVSFIEPYPKALNRILKAEDQYEIKCCGLEDVELEYFEQLEKGDVLFIDSTHVSKIGSDVNYLLFEILPRLKKGVFIHFHDIFYPFEYPYNWIKKEGWIWNELYMLRSFLMNNKDYKIIFFFDYLTKMHADKIWDCLHMENPSGGSFWIEKV